MSAHQLLSAVAVLAAVSSAEDIEVCGLRSARGSPFVRNGEVASNSTEVPWNVAVYDLSAKDGPVHICGGSLIKSNYFVSAAHCFHQKTYRRPVSDFVATVGKRYRDLNTTEDTEQRVQLQSIFYHTYGGSNGLYKNDIAVVQLAQDVSINVNVLPICIDWRNKLPKLESGLLGLVAGFGGYRNNPYETLRYSMLPYLGLEDCTRNLSSTLLFYTGVQDKFCVGVTNGSAAGPGDSGGGLAFETAGQWFLRGIVSLGDGKNAGNSFFTNVSEHIPWMSEITQGSTQGVLCEGFRARVQGDPVEVGEQVHVRINVTGDGHVVIGFMMCNDDHCNKVEVFGVDTRRPAIFERNAVCTSPNGYNGTVIKHNPHSNIETNKKFPASTDFLLTRASKKLFTVQLLDDMFAASASSVAISDDMKHLYVKDHFLQEWSPDNATIEFLDAQPTHREECNAV